MRLTLVVTITLLLGGLLGTVPADAQDAAKVARIGYLGTDSAAGNHTREAFLQGLRDLGYVEGRNCVIEYRRPEGAKVDRLPALATELVALKVDVIFAAAGSPAALAAKKATSTIPIVFPSVTEPVAAGLIASFARPGGNVTGLSFSTSELFAKQIELLKQTVPQVGRVAVLWHPEGLSEPQTKAMLKGAEGAARALGVRLQLVEVRAPDDLDRTFSEMTRGRSQALTVLPNVLLFQERARLADLAAKSGLPAIYPFRVVDAGGLMSYAPNLLDQYRRAATYVAKILRGAKPGDLPVEQPAKFELVINVKAARALGLTIPASVLARADEVIEK